MENNFFNLFKRDKNFFILLIGILTFFIFKILTIVPRFGDSNAYFYMARVFLNGVLPYRNFFLADGPILILIISFFTLFFGGSLFLLQSIPIFFEIANSILIFLFCKKLNFKFPWIASLVYLFSFSIIATSDYVTGVQIVLFFSLLGILFWEKDKPFISGIFWAIAGLTKAYAFPAFFGIFLFGLWKKRFNKIIYLFSGTFITAIIILSPFIILSAKELIMNIFIHHFNRPSGIPKKYIFSFFFNREWLIIFLSFFGFWFKRKTILPWIAIPSFIFLLLFNDLYYLYLNSLFIYLVIAASAGFEFFWKKRRQLFYILFVFWIFFSIISFNYYLNNTRNDNLFPEFEEVSLYVKNLPKDYSLYGSHEIAPLVAIFSNRPLFNNYIDTNTQTFGSGAHNKEKISWEAVEQGIYLVAIVQDYPSFNVSDFGFEGYFSRDIFNKHCKNLKKFSKHTSENEFIGIYECKIIDK